MKTIKGKMSFCAFFVRVQKTVHCPVIGVLQLDGVVCSVTSWPLSLAYLMPQFSVSSAFLRLRL
jgi:hypothetical protein